MQEQRNGTIVNSWGGNSSGTVVNRGGSAAQGTVVNTYDNQEKSQIFVDLKNSDWRSYPTLFQVGDYCQVIAEMSEATEGAQADLYACRWKEERAILKLFRTDAVTQRLEVRFRSMYEKLKECSRATKILEYGVHNNRWYEIMPFYSRGSLADRCQQKTFSENEIVKDILPQMNEALREIHQKGIWHNDIKPQNIMINDQGKLVLIDFGVSVISDDMKTVATRFSGTPGYMNIQAMSGNYSKETDYFALGATVFYLMYRKTPVDYQQGILQGAVLRDPRKNAGLLEGQGKISDRLYSLLQGMLFTPMEGDEDRPFGYSEIKDWLAGKNPKLPTHAVGMSEDKPDLVIRIDRENVQLAEMSMYLGLHWTRGMAAFLNDNLGPQLAVAAQSGRYKTDQCSLALNLRGFIRELWQTVSGNNNKNSLEEELTYCYLVQGIEKELIENNVLDPKYAAFYWQGNAYKTKEDFRDLGEQICRAAEQKRDTFSLLVKDNVLVDFFMSNASREEFGGVADMLKKTQAIKHKNAYVNQYMVGLVLQRIYGSNSFRKKFAGQVLSALRVCDQGASKASNEDQLKVNSFEALVKANIISVPLLSNARYQTERVRSFVAAFALSGQKTYESGDVSFSDPVDLKRKITGAAQDRHRLQKVIDALYERNDSRKSEADYPMCSQLQAWLIIHNR
ncbi:MAG: protein kinase [Clostridia bacterium]|nr:protein kinase [Clostridia bacterium]